MNARRGFDLLHSFVVITWPLWSAILWIDIHVRLLVGIFLILDPHSHQLTAAMEHALIYGVLYTFAVVYAPRSTDGALKPRGVALRGAR